MSGPDLLDPLIQRIKTSQGGGHIIKERRDYPILASVERALMSLTLRYLEEKGEGKSHDFFRSFSNMRNV
jgi:hypothetical protein